MATVCTSFVFINSGTHGRSMTTPEGWREYVPDYMQLGTCLASRSALLALLTWGIGGMWILEQPSTSSMTYLVSWQMLITFFANKGLPSVMRNSVFMAAFRGATLKPTALFSNESLEDLMNLPVPEKKDRPEASAPVSYVCLGSSVG